MSSEKPNLPQHGDQNDGKHSEAAQHANKEAEKQQSEDKPPGGYDATKIPHAPPGYTVKITFHRATHLPMADITTFSSDPYLTAEITTDLQPRHKEDPVLAFRTRTFWKETEPQWEEPWLLAHVPASGFHLKVRVYDEDGSDKDDRLGNVHINIDHVDEKSPRIKNQAYKIKKRSGSKRAYMLRGLAVCLGRAKEMSGDLFVSIEVLGRSEGQEGGRTYTIGPNYWCKHSSPLLGRIAGSHDPKNDPQGNADTADAEKSPDDGAKKKPGRYNFQSNQFQLRGPVPAELYHRYVEFRPIIGSLFTAKGLRGLILHKGLHMQHNRVYNYNQHTEYGVFEEPGEDMSRKFLDLVHYDIGGRIFTYVLTLDALMRFTETGKEFGIDLLSKHTMHSDASIYIAFSGEFFIRRLEHPDRQPPEEAQAKASHGKDKQKQDGKDKDKPLTDEHADEVTGNKSHPPKKIPGGPPTSPPPRDPAYYEIIIDNDSGTYRPNAELLPVLRKFLEANFQGLKVVTLDCNKDKKLMDKLKKEQSEIKKAEGKGERFTQVDDASSLSSEDVEAMQAKANSQQDDDAEAQNGGGPKHKLGEALGPILGNHATMRKVVGAGAR